jgi:uncharacterized protein (DUF433 family)
MTRKLSPNVELPTLVGRWYNGSVTTQSKPSVPMPIILETTLVRTPEVCGGKLRIDGTRLTVNQIVTLYNEGLSPEQIAAQYAGRSLNQIFAAIAWYLDHKVEFDRELADEAESDKKHATGQ